MPSLVNEVIRGLKDGRYDAILKEYCLNWKENASPYALSYAVLHMVDEHNRTDLLSIIMDPDFRNIKLNKMGINSVRDDVNLTLDYFTRIEPSLLPYIQVLFMGQWTG